MELDFLSNKYSLYHLEHFFCHLMEDVAVSTDLRHKIRLCFQEAVTNAVLHGNQGDETKYVQISLNQDENKLIIQVKDEGLGFDLHQLENPLKEENLTTAGGRGIFLIKEFADKLDYLNDKRTLVMEFELAKYQ